MSISSYFRDSVASASSNLGLDCETEPQPGSLTECRNWLDEDHPLDALMSSSCLNNSDIEQLWERCINKSQDSLKRVDSNQNLCPVGTSVKEGSMKSKGKIIPIKLKSLDTKTKKEWVPIIFSSNNNSSQESGQFKKPVIRVVNLIILPNQDDRKQLEENPAESSNFRLPLSLNLEETKTSREPLNNERNVSLLVGSKKEKKSKAELSLTRELTRDEVRTLLSPEEKKIRTLLLQRKRTTERRAARQNDRQLQQEARAQWRASWRKRDYKMRNTPGMLEQYLQDRKEVRRKKSLVNKQTRRRATYLP